MMKYQIILSIAILISSKLRIPLILISSKLRIPLILISSKLPAFGMVIVFVSFINEHNNGIQSAHVI